MVVKKVETKIPAAIPFRNAFQIPSGGQFCRLVYRA